MHVLFKISRSKIHAVRVYSSSGDCFITFIWFELKNAPYLEYASIQPYGRCSCPSK